MSDPLRVFGASLLDEKKLLSSSSGGMFTAIAENAISQGNAVICAVMDYETKRDVFRIIGSASEIHLAQGSKYVQACPGDILADSVCWLNEHPGKNLVMFGLGCQIAGFKAFFDSAGVSDRLLYVDIICHGVPSPQIFAEYLEMVDAKDGGTVEFLSMRDKRNGWTKPYYYCVANGKEIEIQFWARLFYSSLITRPSCHACPYSQPQRLSDITIGDFWGIDRIRPDKFNQKGLSLVFGHSKRGEEFFNSICDVLDVFPMESDADYLQPNLISPTAVSPKRDYFWAFYYKHGLNRVMNKFTRTAFVRRAAKRVLGPFLRPVKNFVETHRVVTHYSIESYRESAQEVAA